MEGMHMNKIIEAALLESFERNFAADPAKRVAQRAATANGIGKAALNPAGG